MALSLCSCAVLLASCRASADTRTGQADGYGGILRVQVMMEDGAISAVNILEQHETDGIGSRALDILPDEMIRMNTWDVDVVTGAAGGVLRDILINEEPLIFRKEIYALACVFGGVVFWACEQVGISGAVLQITTAAAVIALRIVAVHYGLKLPTLKGEEKR